MSIKDYEFNIGDKVITTEGITGKIAYICTCNDCKRRGFDELFWVTDYDLSEHCITKYEAEYGFKNFYQIGKYHFNDFNQGEVLRSMASCEDELKQLRKQLKLIEELEGE